MNATTGTSSENRLYIADQAFTGTNGAEITFTEVSTQHHCECEECKGREDIINKIWKEYCALKDMATWYRSQRMKVVIESEDFAQQCGFSLEVPAGQDPILALLLAYKDLALDGRSPYDDYQAPSTTPSAPTQ